MRIGKEGLAFHGGHVLEFVQDEKTAQSEWHWKRRCLGIVQPSLLCSHMLDKVFLVKERKALIPLILHQ